ncbi:PfkB family carbohydrate kinase [soil metagenome]
MVGIAVTTGAIDVLGIGCAAVDDLIYVDAYPEANSKAPVRESVRDFGGLTATALVAASRLGSRCAFAGVLGNDELSEAVIAHLADEQVDVSLVLQRDDARPVHSMIVVGQNPESRNIFFRFAGVIAAEPGWPNDEVIQSAKVLLIDHVGLAGSIAAARIAREAGIPVVADIEGEATPQLEELLSLIDHLIVSFEFARKLTGLDEPAAIVDRLWAEGRQLVAVTIGADGCWFRSTDDSATQHLPAYKVHVVDTTGCGDVFHGAYASALARGLEANERLSFASAAAALKATQKGGQSGIPTRSVVESFLQEYPR